MAEAFTPSFTGIGHEDSYQTVPPQTSPDMVEEVRFLELVNRYRRANMTLPIGSLADSSVVLHSVKEMAVS